ncbi:hypothetical protein [Pyrococcus yayanosii]|uniref:hypothetical protein n=1 Tax=Pyrococcus yayanosii TaxID=1008460 RepID=UPI0013053566|nr:hypothetical protein [Pyrococcus yayanosii]
MGRDSTEELWKLPSVLPEKSGKRMFLQVWMKDWKILEEEGFKEIGKVEWMEKVFT